MLNFTKTGLAVFGFELRWYGMLIAAGVLCAVLLAVKREKTLGVPKDTALNIALACVPAGIICARIYYVVFSWENYAGSLKDIFNLRQGGLAVYGGVIGGVLAGAVYSAVKKIKIARLADLAAPSLALGQCIGRWGNFFNQEAYGRAILDPKMQFFPLGVYIDGSGWHYAAFFYESLWCAMIVVALLTGERKKIFKKSGDIALWYLLLYAAERSFVEGLRTDSLYIGPLRVSQLVSVAVMIAAACIFALHGKKTACYLPVFTAVMTGVSAALPSGLLTAAFALLTVILAAATYITTNRNQTSTPA